MFNNKIHNDRREWFKKTGLLSAGFLLSSTIGAPPAPRLQRGVSGFEFATRNFHLYYLKTQFAHSHILFRLQNHVPN